MTKRNKDGTFSPGWSDNLWSRKHSKCVECGGNKAKHMGYGLCAICYRKSDRYKDSIKKYRESGKWRKTKKEYDIRIRKQTLSHYSGGSPVCKCCGESNWKFLAFDHINGGGRKHILSINGYKLGQWLRKNEYPDGFQILCHNCNMAKGIYGICPHKK